MAAQELIAIQVNSAPSVDGKIDDPEWAQAPEIVTHDPVADIEIRLKAVYTTDRVFFLVRFPDSTENRVHKNLLWDSIAKQYQAGPKREDTFVFKWSMEVFPVDMALNAGNSHKADVWYWKSARTDHAGRADDKQHIYTDQSLPKTQLIITDSGHSYYLRRRGDSGNAAYRVDPPKGYEGNEIASIFQQTPIGSRADVRARGHWENGIWTLEFARQLDTEHSDDVVFNILRRYRFGVSRYEIAGRPRNPEIEIPDYGSGDVGEALTLRFLR